MMSWGTAGALCSSLLLTWLLARGNKAAVGAWQCMARQSQIAKNENPQANENPKAIHGKFLLEEKSKILPTQRTDRVKSLRGCQTHSVNISRERRMLLLQVTYYLGLICLLLLLFPSRAYLSLKLKFYFYVNVTTNQTSYPIHTSITRRLLQFTVMQHTCKHKRCACRAKYHQLYLFNNPSKLKTENVTTSF